MEIVYKEPKYKLFLKSKSQLAYVFKKYFQPACTKQPESTVSTQYQTLLTQISIEKQALIIPTGFSAVSPTFLKSLLTDTEYFSYIYFLVCSFSAVIV
jgi:hypothetical protein